MIITSLFLQKFKGAKQQDRAVSIVSCHTDNADRQKIQIKKKKKKYLEISDKMWYNGI